MRAREREAASGYQANAALREALFGHCDEPPSRSHPAIENAIGRRAQYAIAMSPALGGDSPRAQSMADDLAQRYPCRPFGLKSRLAARSRPRPLTFCNRPSPTNYSCGDRLHFLTDFPSV